MPLGAREVLVAVRARDVTSRVLKEVGNNFGLLGKQASAASNQMFGTGAALTAVGVGMAGVGAVGISFFNKSIDSFIEYSRQAAYTKTQVDELGVSVEDIADIGLRVADKIPVPFNEIQDALYDIFSSLDIGVKDAEKLLELFSQGAVAGQTDIRTAARSTIAVMNAYQMPFSEANNVMDIMFEMVRKGVGTYEEFNSAIGRAIPAAVSASQEFDTLAGVMAFLTRGGLSTQMAATSAARAMELFTKPDVVKALREIGVEVVNAQGDFKQMDDILKDLAGSKGWSELGDAKRKELFQEIFGVGTIQARRFFDVAIPNFESLINLTDITASSGGALGQAYMTMFNEPAMQAQLLSNKYELLRVEIGEKLLPAKVKLMEAAMDLVDWWNNLSESTKGLTVKIAAGAATFLTIGGIVLTLVGGFMMLAGVVGGVGTAFAILTGVPLVIGAIIAITVALIKNWDTVKEVAGNVRETVVEAFNTMVEKVKGLWEWFNNLSLAGKILVGVVVGLANPMFLVAAGVVAAVRNFDTLVDAAKGVWEWFNNLHMAGKVLIGVIVALQAPWLLVAAAVVAVIKNWSTVVEWAGKLVDAAKGVWEWFNNLSGIFRVVGSVIAGVLLAAISPLLALVASVVGLGMAIYKNWSTIKDVTITVWSAIVDAVDVAWQMFKDFWDWLTNLDIDVWGTIQKAATSAWEAIQSATSTAANAILAVLRPVWSWLQNAFDWFMDKFGNQMVDIWNTLVTEIGALVQELREFLNFAWQGFQYLWDIVKPILDELANQFVAKIKLIVGLIRAMLIPIFKVVSTTIGESFAVIGDLLGILWQVFQVTWDIILTVVKTGIKIVGSVIGAGIDIILLIWKHFGEFLWKPIKSTWDIVAAIVKAGIKIVSNTLQLIMNLIQGDFGEAWENVKNIFKAAWEGLLGVAKGLFDKFKSLFFDLPVAIVEFLSDAADVLVDLGVDIIMGLIDGASKTLSLLFEFFKAIGPQIVDLFTDAAVWLIEIGKSIVSGMWEGLQVGWDTVLDFLDSIHPSIVDFFTGALTWLYQSGKWIIEGLYNAALEGFETILSWGGTIAQVFVDFFTGAITWLYQSGKDIIQGLYDAALEGFDVVLEWGGTIASMFIDFFDGAITWLYQAGKWVIQGAWDGVKAVWNLIVDWIHGDTGIQKTFKNSFSNAIDWLKDGGKNVLNGLWSGIKDVWTDIKDWFSDVPGKILDALGIASPPAWSIQAGKDIAHGIFKGLGLGIGSTMDFLMGLGPEIVGKIISATTGSLGDIIGGLGNQTGDLGAFFGTYKELGRQMAEARGWTGLQWSSLLALWQAESGWNPHAKNPSSGAFGIPQSLPASKMGAAALSGDPWTMAANQMQWGMNYIADRYGNPAAAWGAWNARSPHWYEKGAWEIAQNELAYLHRGEMVVPKKFADAIRNGQGTQASPGRGATFNFHGDVTFGSDMQRSTADLDFWSRTATSGV